MRRRARHALLVLSIGGLIGAALWWGWGGWDRFGPPLPEPAGLAEMDAEVAVLIREALASARARPGDEARRLHLGMVYEANQLPASARACYERVVQARPGDVKAWYRLACARSETGDLAGAIEAMGRAAQLDPDLVAAAGRCGHWLLDVGDVDAAERHLERALALEPDDEVALLGRARIHLERRQPEEAIALLRDGRLLERPNQGYAHGLLATAHRQRGDLAGTERALAGAGDRRLRVTDPYSRELAGLKPGTRNRRLVAQTMMREGRHAEALPLLVQARRGDPDNPRILNALAICQLELGQVDACLETFHDSLRIDPDDYVTNVQLAEAYWTISQSRPIDLTVAMTHVERALRLQPEAALAHQAKARILMATQRLAEAIDVLKRAFALDARDPSLLTQAGFLECDLERWDQAIDTFETALEHESMSATPLVGLARARMGRGELGPARSALDRARRRRLDHPQLLEAVEAQLIELERAEPVQSTPERDDADQP